MHVSETAKIYNVIYWISRRQTNHHYDNLLTAIREKWITRDRYKFLQPVFSNSEQIATLLLTTLDWPLVNSQNITTLPQNVCNLLLIIVLGYTSRAINDFHSKETHKNEEKQRKSQDILLLDQ